MTDIDLKYMEYIDLGCPKYMYERKLDLFTDIRRFFISSVTNK